MDQQIHNGDKPEFALRTLQSIIMMLEMVTDESRIVEETMAEITENLLFLRMVSSEYAVNHETQESGKNFSTFKAK